MPRRHHVGECIFWAYRDRRDNRGGPKRAFVVYCHGLPEARKQSGLNTWYNRAFEAW